MRRDYIMNKLIVEKIYIFSPSEKKAKVIELSEGTNIITSSRIDGNKKGKSVVLKTIYHTLGADCKFDDQWQDSNKVYILKLKINDNIYYMYRQSRMFKFVNQNFEMMFQAIDRKILAQELEKILNFAVKLPNRSEDKLEITPPVYNYLLNYVDQDGMNCTKFSSFNQLEQYAKYKENALYYHLGIFNDEYYNIIKELEKRNENKKIAQQKKDVIENMLNIILNNLNNMDYCKNLETLKLETEKYKYSKIIQKLNSIKNKIINLKNDKEDLILTLNELKESTKKTDKEIKEIINHTCPFCNSKVENNIEISIKKYNEKEDLYLISSELEINLTKINSELEMKQKEYESILYNLKEYEEKLNLNNQEIDDILKYKGFNEMKEKLLIDSEDVDKELNILEKEIKEYNKKKKEYEELKKDVNNEYFNLMHNDKIKFNLKEIEDTKLDNIGKNYTVGGSSRSIATIVWYMNLLKLKYKYNKNAIHFPLVLDSPQNTELDDIRKNGLIDYIFDNINNQSQLIISLLGYNSNEYNVIPDKVINFDDNNTYELLNNEDFEKNQEILNNFVNLDNIKI
jgi:hypothetical protein